MLRRQDPSGLFLSSPSPLTTCTSSAPPLATLQPRRASSLQTVSVTPPGLTLGPASRHACPLLNPLTQPFHHTRSASPQPRSLVTSRLLHAHPQAAEETHSCANWHQDRFRAAYPLGAWGFSAALPGSPPSPFSIFAVPDLDLSPSAHLCPLTVCKELLYRESRRCDIGAPPPTLAPDFLPHPSNSRIPCHPSYKGQPPTPHPRPTLAWSRISPPTLQEGSIHYPLAQHLVSTVFSRQPKNGPPFWGGALLRPSFLLQLLPPPAPLLLSINKGSTAGTLVSHLPLTSWLKCHLAW